MPFGSCAGVNAEEHELADERIVPELERETGELGLVVDDGLDRLAVAVLTLHRRNVDRAREVIDDAIEQALHALLLEGGAGDHAGELQRDRGLADAEHAARRRVISSPLRYFSAMTSSKSETASISLSRYSLAWAVMFVRNLASSTGFMPSGSVGSSSKDVGDVLHEIDRGR